MPTSALVCREVPLSVSSQFADSGALHSVCSERSARRVQAIAREVQPVYLEFGRGLLFDGPYPLARHEVLHEHHEGAERSALRSVPRNEYILYSRAQLKLEILYKRRAGGDLGVVHVRLRDSVRRFTPLSFECSEKASSSASSVSCVEESTSKK